jgi:hypothetical protein
MLHLFNGILHLLESRPNWAGCSGPMGAMATNSVAGGCSRASSQVRVYVEHVIRVIKIFRIAKEEFRMRMPMYEIVIGCVFGLVRLREQYA